MSGGGGHLLPDWPYALELVRIDELFVDSAYQRPLTSFAAKIVEDFDPRLLAPIVVSVRKKGANGAIVDGQTRVEAFRRLRRDVIPALVFRGTREQEAELFARFQSERRTIRPFHRFRAQLVAKDAAALGLSEVVKRHGYELIDASASVRPWGITAIRACEVLYAAGRLDGVLAITAKAWAPRAGERTAYGAGHPLNNELLRGLSDFIGRREDLDPDRMSRRLATTNPQEIGLRAGHLRQGRGTGGNTAIYVRQVLEQLYDSRAVRAAS